MRSGRPAASRPVAIWRSSLDCLRPRPPLPSQMFCAFRSRSSFAASGWEHVVNARRSAANFRSAISRTSTPGSAVKAAAAEAALPEHAERQRRDRQRAAGLDRAALAARGQQALRKCRGTSLQTLWHVPRMPDRCSTDGHTASSQIRTQRHSRRWYRHLPARTRRSGAVLTPSHLPLHPHARRVPRSNPAIEE